MLGGFFFATRDSSGFCDWSQSNVKAKLFPAFISRRSSAERGAACCLAPVMINSIVYHFFNARRSVARRLVGPHL